MEERYHIVPEEGRRKEEILALVAKERGCLAKGGEADTARAAGLLLDDFRSGRLGRITLEFPEPEKKRCSMGSKEGKTGIVREVLSFFLYVAIVVGITFLIIHYVGQRTYVSGSSMENTLSDGDNLIVDKLTYRFSDHKKV